MKKITIVAALDQRGGIGKAGALPWKLPEDLQHFKCTTAYSAMIMGRKTFESIGRVLPNRRHVVVTRQKGWSHPGVDVAHSLEEAIAMINDLHVFVIGGGELYKQALPLCDYMVLTHVYDTFDCDTFFPDFNRGEWSGRFTVDHVDAESGTRFCFGYWLRQVGGKG